MRWPWQRREPRDVDPALSPFNKKIIRKGDPAWDVMQEALSRQEPMAAIWDHKTGKILKVVPLSELDQVRRDIENGKDLRD